jgi:hypothetical protein
VHGVDELLQRDAAVVILVEDVKHPLHKEWLKRILIKIFIYVPMSFLTRKPCILSQSNITATLCFP